MVTRNDFLCTGTDRYFLTRWRCNCPERATTAPTEGAEYDRCGRCNEGIRGAAGALLVETILEFANYRLLMRLLFFFSLYLTELTLGGTSAESVGVLRDHRHPAAVVNQMIQIHAQAPTQRHHVLVFGRQLSID